MIAQINLLRNLGQGLHHCLPAIWTMMPEAGAHCGDGVLIALPCKLAKSSTALCLTPGAGSSRRALTAVMAC